MNERLKHTDIEFCMMSSDNWADYVKHINDSGDFYFHYAMEETPELLEKIQNPTPDVIYYSLILRDSKDMAGYIGFSKRDNCIEIYIFKEHRRKHYGYEALKAFAELCLDGVVTRKKVDEVYAQTLYDNDPANGLLKKAGFERIATGFRMNLAKGSTSTELIHTYRYCRM